MYYNTFLLEMNSGEIWASVATFAVVSLILVIVAVVRKGRFNSRALAYGAVSVGLSFVLSFIKIPLSGLTGSVTLASFVPLVLYAYFFGTGAGALAGILYGLLQFLQNPYFLTPVQFILDYVLAFGAPMTAGVVGRAFRDVKKGLPTAVVVACAVRLAMHCLAGVIFYMEWKVDSLVIFGSTANMGAFLYSFLYNAIYMLPETAVALAVAVPLSSQKRLMSTLAMRDGETVDLTCQGDSEDEK